MKAFRFLTFTQASPQVCAEPRVKASPTGAIAVGLQGLALRYHALADKLTRLRGWYDDMTSEPVNEGHPDTLYALDAVPDSHLKENESGGGQGTAGA